MDHVYLSIFYLIFVTACTSGDKDAAIQRELADKTFPTTSYNYTSYDLRIIKFQQVTLPFKIDEAPDGGFITSNRLSEEKLDNGETVRFMSHNSALFGKHRLIRLYASGLCGILCSTQYIMTAGRKLAITIARRPNSLVRSNCGYSARNRAGAARHCGIPFLKRRHSASQFLKLQIRASVERSSGPPEACQMVNSVGRKFGILFTALPTAPHRE